MRALLVGLLALVLASFAFGSGSDSASAQSSTAAVAIDADTSGNKPDAVGTVDDCVSASVGQPVDIDIVIPGPGVPADRGISGYQFRFFFDVNVVRVEAEDTNLLLAEAGGSRVIAFSEPTPNNTGAHFSVAVDFGPKGIEPSGASETGPGVVSRLTLLPLGNGGTNLVLEDVEIIDDDSQRISVDSVLPARIEVGQPCAIQGQSQGQSQGVTPTPSPTPSPAVTVTPSQGAPASAGGPASGVGSLAPVASSVPAWAAVAAGLGGAGLAASLGTAFRLIGCRGSRGRASPRANHERNPPRGE